MRLEFRHSKGFVAQRFGRLYLTCLCRSDQHAGGLNRIMYHVIDYIVI